MRSFDLLLLLAAVALFGCREPRTTADMISDLRNPSAQVRRSAADGLRMDEGVPAEAIGPLLAAAQVERHRPAFGAMMITLGRSGVAEAKPLIDARIPEPDPDMRRWAARALKYWMIANRQLPPDPQLPDGWPYGQPGFPPPLPAE